MKVALVHRDYGDAIAGAANMVRATAAELTRRGHEVRTLTAATPVDPYAEARRLGAWADVVHAFDLADLDYPELARAAAAGAGVPFVLTPATAAELWPDRRAGFEVCRAAAAVLALTEREARLLAEAGVDEERIRVIGQGAYLHATGDAASFRARHGLRSDPLVLFLGRKTRTKGYVTLLEAMPAVWAERPEARFAFVGPDWDGDTRAVFAAHADRRVLDLPLVSEHEKRSALEACDVVCLPTTADASPLVFIEAWCCAKPLVTGRFPGVEDLVEDGRNAVVVDPDPPAVAGAILRVLGDPALSDALGRAGLAETERGNNWEAVGEAIEATYAAVLAAEVQPA